MEILIRILKCARKWRTHLIIATVSLLFVTGLNLVGPAIIRKLFEVIKDNPDNAENKILIFSLILLGTYLLRMLCQFINNYFAHITAWYSVAKVRGDVYNHLQKLSMKYYCDKQTGQLMSRIIEDTANFEVLIAHALPDLVSGILVFIGVLIIIFFINPLLALLTCIPIPFIFLSTLLLKKIRRFFTERQKVSAELNGLLQDNFSGIKEIQIFGKEEYEFDKVLSKANLHAKKSLKGLFYVAIMHPAIGMLSGFGTLIVVAFGGYFALQGKMDVADITVFLLYLGLFYGPVTTFSRILEDIQTALVSGRRVFEILDTESDVKDTIDAHEMGNIKGDIEFKNVSFDYTPEIAVLHNVSFKVKAGQMIALVGPTGAGKSTIASLIARFYDPINGEILIDDNNINRYTLTSLRSHISVVFQDVFLFNGTIAQNIAYSKKEAVSQEEIENAAKIACIHEFIISQPDGYNTLIGERGMRLSGGQKQRLAIARAVLRGAPILILDEATSAVDNETESHIQEAINHLMGKITIIVIAHRLSTVEKADEILVLNDGKIIEQGNHKKLITSNGPYASLYQKTL